MCFEIIRTPIRPKWSSQNPAEPARNIICDLDVFEMIQTPIMTKLSSQNPAEPVRIILI
jgi:hypothetical protein